MVGGPSLLYHKEEYLYLKFFNSTTSSGGLLSLKATTKNALLSTKTKVRFMNDVCLRQMMLVSPHFMANIASLRNEVEQHHICEANAS